MDLRGTIILNKNPKALAWKSFHKLHFKYYYTQLPSMLLFTHIFFMNNTFPCLRIKSLSHTSILLLCFFSKNKILFFSLVLSKTLPWACFLVQWKLENPSHQSMAPSSFMNRWKSRMIFLSNGNEDENPYAQWTTRKVPFSNQIGW